MRHPTLEETVEFMKQAHEGQLDKSGKPYYLHPLAVAEIVRDVYGANEAEQHAALLHDILEDTPVTEQDLLERGYSNEVVNLVRWVSKHEGLTYRQWMQSLANHGPFGAVKIKLADNQHNMGRLTPELKGMEKRYSMAREILLKRFNR